MAKLTIDDLPKSYGGKVTLRKKPIAKGGWTLYLDFYDKGNKGHKRHCEYLDLRLLPENTPADRKTNLDTLKTADTVARDKSAAADKTGAGFDIKEKSKSITLCEVMAMYEAKRLEDGRSSERGRRINDCSRHLEIFLKGDKYKSFLVSDVDKGFCERFIAYLKTAKGLKKNVPLSARTQRAYLDTFTSGLNYAFREGYIKANPMTMIDRRDKIKTDKESAREYLTIDEVKLLASMPCKNEQVKRAFMFSCFCGLRLSDILDLKWKHLEKVGDKVCVDKIIVKTNKSSEHLPLSKSAIAWIPTKPEGSSKDDVVFDGLPVKEYISNFVEKWVRKCGIDKHISFHCARHTFATMSLTLGVDLYVLSKLMGHSNVDVTQIYAKIVDKRKEQAINLLNNVLD